MTTKKYTNGTITILWQPKKCIHSGICVKTLPKVYNPKQKPWIQMKNATTQQLKDQVATCPSGALSIENNPQPVVRVTREDNGKKGRYVLHENEEFAGEMTFTWAGNNKFIIDHTGVEEGFEGKGYGKLLVLEAVEFARKKGIKIIPLCPFAKHTFDKDATLKDVLF